MAANRVVEIDSVQRKLVKLAGILLSGRTGISSHSSIINFHNSWYLFSQNASFEILGRFLNTLQLKGIPLL